MRDNITKVVERHERLDSLQDQTGLFFYFFFLPTLEVLPSPPSCCRDEVVPNVNAHAPISL